MKALLLFHELADSRHLMSDPPVFQAVKSCVEYFYGNIEALNEHIVEKNNKAKTVFNKVILHQIIKID